jgi:hypothetical protein
MRSRFGSSTLLRSTNSYACRYAVASPTFAEAATCLAAAAVNLAGAGPASRGRLQLQYRGGVSTTWLRIHGSRRDSAADLSRKTFMLPAVACSVSTCSPASYACMNQSCERFGMLTTVYRCALRMARVCE